MKIQYCPVCMSELIEVGMIAFACPYCKVAFHISIGHKIDSLKLEDSDNE